MVKDIDDYLDFVKKKYFYSIPRSELKEVLMLGFWRIYELMKGGQCIRLRNDWYTAFFGHRFFDDKIRLFYMYSTKRSKLRMMHAFRREKSKGYFFGFERKLTIARCKRPVVGYKVKEEAYLNKKNKYFYVLNAKYDGPSVLKLNEIPFDCMKLIAYRSNRDYEIIELDGN